MIPRPFEYYAPASIPDALGLLKKHGDEAKLLAGGHSLLPMMKLRFAQPGHVIDLGKISELRGIREDGGTIRIGAMTSENDLIWSALLQKKCPLLVEGARQISDPQVRYRGTIGGDICHGDPANDHPALMLALGASFVLRSSAGERVVPADGFFVGMYATGMQADEIMTEIRVPTPPPGTGSCYSKLKRKVGDFATAAAAVTLTMKGETVSQVAIALTNVGPTPLKARAAEDALRGKPLTDENIGNAARLAMSICDPSPDQRGSTEYKTAMAGEMTQRALRTAGSRALR
ncbi:MAG TPA: xanthine dehydrogenase family protein subunit M [Steroidobacteraceae bacterium]|nr:xanthine dehydrogenase family protein subunit M [Steroidobacteraceae bacterium]